MCLGIPVKIIELKQGFKGIVEFAGIRKEVDLRFTPKVKVGDYVILHAGFSIERVTPESAQETYRVIDQIQ